MPDLEKIMKKLDCNPYFIKWVKIHECENFADVWINCTNPNWMFRLVQEHPTWGTLSKRLVNENSFAQAELLRTIIKAGEVQDWLTETYK